MKYKKNKTLLNIVRTLLLKPFLCLAYDFQLKNVDNIPMEGPAAIIMKHQSWVDIIAAGGIIPRAATYMGKYELMENIFGDFPGSLLFHIGKIINPFSSWVLRSLGMIPINRDNPARMISSFKEMRKMLEKGDCIVVYPEGKVVKNRMGDFKSGLIRMFQRFQKKSGIKIKFVPVGISYGRKHSFRKKMIVKVGEPMEFDWNDKSATDKIKERVAELTDFNLE
ncbi:MAG: 1-acyl-sn-glycerol-3-phosphate acyltransferase [Candidatus Eremiobacteraeota bacterium]|nr:1-acyl-sn-glycerol-3-phosphate acyltransferase [Candidatus Eremiobacteraeota bacterium]